MRRCDPTCRARVCGVGETRPSAGGRRCGSRGPPADDVEPTHGGGTVNAANPGMFTVTNDVYTPIEACIDQYDQMKIGYGL